MQNGQIEARVKSTHPNDIRSPKQNSGISGTTDAETYIQKRIKPVAHTTNYLYRLRYFMPKNQSKESESKTTVISGNDRMRKSIEKVKEWQVCQPNVDSCDSVSDFYPGKEDHTQYDNLQRAMPKHDKHTAKECPQEDGYPQRVNRESQTVQTRENINRPRPKPIRKITRCPRKLGKGDNHDESLSISDFDVDLTSTNIEVEFEAAIGKLSGDTLDRMVSKSTVEHGMNTNNNDPLFSQSTYDKQHMRRDSELVSPKPYQPTPNIYHKVKSPSCSDRSSYSDRRTSIYSERRASAYSGRRSSEIHRKSKSSNIENRRNTYNSYFGSWKNTENGCDDFGKQLKPKKLVGPTKDSKIKAMADELQSKGILQTSDERADNAVRLYKTNPYDGPSNIPESDYFYKDVNSLRPNIDRLEEDIPTCRPPSGTDVMISKTSSAERRASKLESLAVDSNRQISNHSIMGSMCRSSFKADNITSLIGGTSLNDGALHGSSQMGKDTVKSTERVFRTRGSVMVPHTNRYDANFGPPKTNVYDIRPTSPITESYNKQTMVHHISSHDLKISPAQENDNSWKSGHSLTASVNDTCKNVNPGYMITLQDCPDIGSKKDHFCTIGRYLNQLYKHDQLTDTVVKVGNHTFSAHLVVLACHSGYFNQFAKGQKDGRHIKLPYNIDVASKITPSAFVNILEYMYNGELNVDVENVAEIIHASSCLGMELSRRKGEYFLKRLSSTDALAVLEISHKQLIRDAVEGTLFETIASDFGKASQSAEFRSLCVDCLCDILRRDDLMVTSEIEVGNAAIEWINHEIDNRLFFESRVLSYIRFALLTQQELFSFANNADYILKDENVKKELFVANWYQSSLSAGIPTKLEISVPKPRHHLTDPSRAPSIEQVKPTKPSSKTKVKRRSSAHGSEWETLASSYKAMGHTENNFIIMIGGYDPDSKKNHGIGRRIMGLHLETGTWEELGAKIPHPRTHHCVQYFNGYVFVIGGCDPTEVASGGSQNPTKTTYRCDTQSGSWKEMTNMKYARIHHCMSRLNDYIFVFGGQDETNTILSFGERYDLVTNKWSDIAPMHCSRIGCTAAATKDGILIMGGFGARQGHSEQMLDDVEFYNTKTNRWTDKARIPSARCFSSACVADDRVFVCGGVTLATGDTYVPVPDVLVYYTTMDTWSTLVNLVIPVYETEAIYYNNTVYVLGGIDGVGKARAELQKFDTIAFKPKIKIDLLPYNVAGTKVFFISF